MALTKNSVVIRASRLSLPKPNRPKSGNHDDRRVAIAQRRRIGLRARVVVGRVVARDRGRSARRSAAADAPCPRLPDPTARTSGRCASAGNDPDSSCPSGTGRRPSVELANVSAVVRPVVVSDDAAVRRDRTAEVRQHGRRGPVAIDDSGHARPAEQRPARRARVILDELAHLIDRPDAVQVTLVLGIAPGEETVARRASCRRTRDVPRPRDAASAPSSKPGRCHGTHTRRRPKRTLNSASLSAPLALAASAMPSPDGDGPRGERQERVQRRVDRGRDPVLAERAQRVERHHLVFVRFAAIPRHQLLELVEVEQGESGGANRSQVAAAALHRQHADRRARQWIGQRRTSSWCCRRRNW